MPVGVTRLDDPMACFAASGPVMVSNLYQTNGDESIVTESNQLELRSEDYVHTKGFANSPPSRRNSQSDSQPEGRCLESVSPLP